VWASGVISQLGDWSARLALALLVLERSGSAAVVGVVGVLFIVPWLGIGQTLTAWSTKYSRKAVMITCDSFRGVSFVVIGLASPSTPILLVIVALAALADPVFEATKSAFVTEIVPKGEYGDAIKVSHAANQASSLVGYAVGGVLVGLVGAESTLVLNGATFLLSAALVFGVARSGRQAVALPAKASLSASIAYLRRDRVSALGFLTTLIAVTAAMSVESQAAVYGKIVAGFSDEGIGLMTAVSPATTLVVVALMKTSGNDGVLLARGLATSALAAVAAGVLLFLGVDGALAFVAFACVGVIFGFLTMTQVVVGRRLPDENRVGIFSILQSGVFLGLSVGALAGGAASELTSPETAAGVALALGACGLLIAIPYALKSDVVAPTE
jgi:predicted MFS family arabinose efflux permease